MLDVAPLLSFSVNGKQVRITSAAARRLSQRQLAACRAAFDYWVARGDADLTTYLDEALRALAAGFAQPDPARPRRPVRR